jgi:hypothetical protein
MFVFLFLQFNLFIFCCWTIVVADEEGSNKFHTYIYEIKNLG